MSTDLQEQYDKIFRYCYFKVKNQELAEDLTQEAFLRYFRQNPSICHGKSLAYLYTIAKNLCIDFFRKKQTEPLEENFLAIDPADALLTNLVVRQAVESLSEELSEVILLRFGSDLGIHEISLILNISRFAVHRKINAALKALKQILREEDF